MYLIFIMFSVFRLVYVILIMAILISQFLIMATEGEVASHIEQSWTNANNIICLLQALRGHRLGYRLG